MTTRRWRRAVVRTVVMAAVPGAVALALLGPGARSQDPGTGVPVGAMLPAPPRGADEGIGPLERLVIRGATVIDGTGAEPAGPKDVVIEGNRIARVVPAAPRDAKDPYAAEREIDARGMFVTPGLIDMHVHAGFAPFQPYAEYVYKLWLAHGITSVRGVPLFFVDQGMGTSEKARSARNEIVAPRIFDYAMVPDPIARDRLQRGAPQTPEQAREYARGLAAAGVDGIKLRDPPVPCDPEVMRALLDEGHELGLGNVAHLGQRCVERVDGLQAAENGLDTITHFYGHFESLLKPGEQLFPEDYDFSDEEVRFSQVADWVNKIHGPGTPEWKAYLRRQKELGTVFDPTFTIYVANRDVGASRDAAWHREYLLPSLELFFRPNPLIHGSYFFDWGTDVEKAWKTFYDHWMRLTFDYWKIGGRITTGSDAGFIYSLYGFGLIRELELLREAGLPALEVMKAATLNGARTLYEPKGTTDPPIGVVAEGKLADLVITPVNPLTAFDTLYGTGAERLDEQTGEVVRVGGVRWTIKDGIVYDAPKLLADVAAMADDQRGEVIEVPKVLRSFFRREH